MCDTLLKLATQSGLVATFVGAAISVILELWSGWEKWAHKRRAVFILCLAFPVGALLIGAGPMACAGMALNLDAFALAFFAGFEAFLASTALFKLVVRPYIRNR